MTIHLVSSMATSDLLAELATLPEFSSLSVQSAGGVTVAARVRAGEAADVVVLGSGAIAALADEGHVDAAHPLFVSETVLAVAQTADVAAPRTVEELADLLSGSPSIGYSTGPSGNAFLALLQRLGLHDELAGRLVQARPGQPVGALVATGDAALGIQQRSEFTGVPGVLVLGPLPGEAAATTIFAGAVARTAQDPAASRALLCALSDPRHHPLIRRHGMEPA